MRLVRPSSVVAGSSRARGLRRAGGRRSLGVLALTATSATVVGAWATPALAAPSGACRAPLTASLSSHDPTALADRPTVTLKTRTGRALSAVQVRLIRNGRSYASGAHAGSLKRGTNHVDLRVARALPRGSYRIVTSARVAGCGSRVRTTQRWTMKAASLPVRVVVRDRTSQGGKTVVKVLVRTVAGRRASGLRVALQARGGKQLANAKLPGTLIGATEVQLWAAGDLAAGTYDVVVTGRAGSVSARATQKIVLPAAGSAGGSADGPAPRQQRAVVDWSGGKPDGRDAVAVALPGIGYGELVCSPGTQWIRVFPSDPRREVAMMNWTYKDWRENSGKALREGLYTRFTGPDFSERFSEFIPSEKRSTGEFVGLISERGTIGGPGDGPFAAPISLRLTWEWDFSKAGEERCHAELDLTAQTAGEGPQVSSAQLVWRGDAAAAGRSAAETTVPGVGRLSLVCEPGAEGQRTVTLDTAAGGRITTRESTWDTTVPQAFGPIVQRLPNNGQLQFDLDGGTRVLIASRWKTNDPDPTANFCAIAAQAVTP